MVCGALSASPASAASRNCRTDVFSADLTALLRWRAFSFCLLRLIWDLIFATRVPRWRSDRVGQDMPTARRPRRRARRDRCGHAGSRLARIAQIRPPAQTRAAAYRIPPAGARRATAPPGEPVAAHATLD